MIRWKQTKYCVRQATLILCQERKYIKLSCLVKLKIVILAVIPVAEVGAFITQMHASGRARFYVDLIYVFFIISCCKL